MAAGTLLHPVDIEPALLLSMHAAWPEVYPALLESAAVGRPLGRFDILFAHPGERLTLHSDGALSGGAGQSPDRTFLDALDSWWERERTGSSTSHLPFTGGWLLYLGYELAGQIEPRLRLLTPAFGPVAEAIRIPAAIIHDHEAGRSWIVAEPSAAHIVDRIKADLATARRLTPAQGDLVARQADEDDPVRFLGAVARSLEYIAAGDIYQANLSRSWRAQLRDDIQAAHVYQRLRETNPGPFNGIARFGDMSVISSSPERLVQVVGRKASTRPIAGTRPRGADPETDRLLIEELRGHPKERAEHIMLIDLERNDLGRVCESGTVHVDEFMTIESYAHVHHIVSNVTGVLRPGVTPGQVLAAIFPGGTISGCPKVRCLEIIGELELEARGPYTGSLGYLNRDGGMDTNILIRSMALHGRELVLRAGAGIVADSVPARELSETRAKARGVLRALAHDLGDDREAS